jgi:signal transduction histidine kinase
MTDSLAPPAPWPPSDAVEARIDTLLEIARTINSELDLERLFWVIYEQCSRVFDTRNFLLATCDSDGENIEIKVWFYRGRQLHQPDLHEGRLQGLSPEVIRTRQPLAVPDYIAAIHERGLIIPRPTDEQEHLTWMGVPILIGERLIGVLATSRPGLPYTNEDLHLFQAIAAQCAVAIENANLLGMVSETVRELVRRTDELQGLNVISAAVNRSLDLPTVLEQGIVAVRRVSGWEVATIRLWNPATHTWDLAAQEGLPEGSLFDGPIHPSNPIYPYIEEMLAERFPVLLDTATDPVLASYRAFGRHGVLFPLQIGDEVLGLLLLGTSRPLRGIGPGAMMADQTLLAIGDQLAMAIQNARLLTDVQTARSHLTAVLDTTSDGVIFYDRGGHIELANRAVHALYGVPPGTFRGKTYAEVSAILRPLLKDPAVLDQVREVIEADSTATTIAELELARPTRRILSRLTTPVVDEKGEQIGRLSAYHDITEANDLARRTQELAGLNAVAMAINRSFDLKTVLGLAAESLLKVTGWDTATIRLWNPVTRCWDLGARRGVGEPALPPAEEVISEHDPLYENATPELLAGRAMSIDPTGDPALRPYRALGLLRVVMLPVQTRGQVLGIIVLGALRPEAARDAEAMLADSTLAAVGEQLAVAVENARLQSQAQQAAALEERHRLARDLHDSVTQSLFTVTLMAEAAQAMIDRDPVRVAGYLERLKDTAHTALAEMRALLNQLRPQGLSAAGLGAALRKHAETVGAQVGLAVTVEVDENLPDLSPAIEEALYRIAQEALHNVVKHAQASAACIKLNAIRPRPTAPPQAVVLSVEDNGQGFATALDLTIAGGGLGLTSMRERATSLGGSFAIGPRPDGGIAVTVAIPLT